MNFKIYYTAKTDRIRSANLQYAEDNGKRLYLVGIKIPNSKAARKSGVHTQHDINWSPSTETSGHWNPVLTKY